MTEFPSRYLDSMKESAILRRTLRATAPTNIFELILRKFEKLSYIKYNTNYSLLLQYNLLWLRGNTSDIIMLNSCSHNFNDRVKFWVNFGYSVT